MSSKRTKSYEFLYAITNLISHIMIILTIILLILRFYALSFLRIEKHLRSNVVRIETVIDSIMAMNLILSFMAGCVFGIGRKLYFKVHLVICFIFLSLMFGLTTYMKFGYIHSFTSVFSEKCASDSSLKGNLMGEYECVMFGEESCDQLILVHLRKIIFYGTLIQSISFIVLFIQFCITRMAISIKVNEEEEEEWCALTTGSLGRKEHEKNQNKIHPPSQTGRSIRTQRSFSKVILEPSDPK